MTLPRTLTPLLLLAISAASTGCVSQAAFDRLVSINRQLEEQNTVLEQRIEELEQTIRDKQAFIDAMSDQSSANAALRARLTEEQATVAKLKAEVKALRDELSRLGTGAGEIVVIEGIPQEVSDALRELAAANADLMVYDEARGMIRLRSDLTFALGSADVSDAAKTALGRLAGVLNSAAASDFDIQVVGHTDAVPVNSARGKQLFIDNLGLSSNRGDAVARVLIANGTKASRIMSGGRGSTQPIAANDSKGRSKANRRVEIFLVKAADAGAPAPVAPDPAPAGGGVIEGDAAPADDSIFK